MDFDVLDKQMRYFEQSLDRVMLKGIFLVARLDGHGFTKLTKKQLDLEKPFDVRFRDMMIGTLKHLMDCGFRLVYGYTQSDEISILFHFDENTFARKERKLLSILAGEASATFSLLAEYPAVFDCRLVPLPQVDDVIDYFRWRQEDANRNALNSHCYWLLRKEGLSVSAASQRLKGASVSDKNELLFSRGINYNDLPLWQKRGVGLYYCEEQRQGYNPKAQETTIFKRHVLQVDLELPIGQDYSTFIRKLLDESK